MSTKFEFAIKNRFENRPVRLGELELGPHTICTPFIWLGHSLKSRLDVRSLPDLECAPLIVSLGDTFQKPSLYDRIADTGVHKHLKSRAPVMIDSGGFKLLMSRDLHFDVGRAIDFFRAANGDISVTLDYPLSLLASYQENRQRWRKTVRNMERIIEALPHLTVMPVIHGLTLRQIESSCETIHRRVGQPSVLGLGSLVPLITARYTNGPFRYDRRDGSPGNEATFIADAITLIRNRFPRAFLHVFGVGSTTTALVILALGADSVDSASWRTKAAYGKIHLPGMSDRYLRQNRNGRNDHPALNGDEREVLRACQCPICSSFKCSRQHVRHLETSFKSRALHNAWVLDREVAELRAVIRQGAEIDWIKRRLRKSHRFWPVISMLGT